MGKIIATIRGSVFRLLVYLFKKNIRLGNNLMIYKKLDIRGPGRVEIGNNCSIYGILGDRHQYVTLYTYSSESIIRIGDNARIFAARVSSKYSVTVGDDVLIEESGIADTDFHSIDKDRGTPRGETRDRCQVIIGNRVAIGSRCIISKGVCIGDDCIIGPGSVVVRSLAPGSFALGNPARVVLRP